MGEYLSHRFAGVFIFFKKYSDQRFSVSAAENPLPAKPKAFNEPALTPAKKSNSSKILFPEYSSYLERNIKPARALTPPPSKLNTLMFLFGRPLRRHKAQGQGPCS